MTAICTRQSETKTIQKHFSLSANDQLSNISYAEILCLHFLVVIKKSLKFALQLVQNPYIIFTIIHEYICPLECLEDGFFSRSLK